MHKTLQLDVTSGFNSPTWLFNEIDAAAGGPGSCLCAALIEAIWRYASAASDKAGQVDPREANPSPVQLLLLGHKNIASMVRYLGSEVDDKQLDRLKYAGRSSSRRTHARPSSRDDSRITDNRDGAMEEPSMRERSVAACGLQGYAQTVNEAGDADWSESRDQTAGFRRQRDKGDQEYQFKVNECGGDKRLRQPLVAACCSTAAFLSALCCVCRHRLGADQCRQAQVFNRFRLSPCPGSANGRDGSNRAKIRCPRHVCLQ